MNNILKALLVAVFVFGLSSCTSKNVEEAGDADLTEDLAEESDSTSEGGETADAEEDSGDFDSDQSESKAEVADGEESSEDSLEEEGAEGEVADTEGEDLPDEPAPTESQELATNDAEPPPPVAEEPVPETTTDMAMSGSDESQGLSEAPAARPAVPLKKALTTPYTKDGINVNAIYVAREGDSLSSVSQKIYGQDKVKELKNINPQLANRDLKVGDKIYYNSPQRPTDSTQLLTFYEDAGVPPQVYTAAAGDNIRAVSKNLLGNENSWKEIWATNPDVESKDELSEGTRLRYWPSGPEAPVIAANQAPPPQDMAMNEPPPPAEPPAMADTPPPVMEQEVPPPAVAMTEPPPPSEPPPPMEPPPPPVSATAEGEGGAAEFLAGMDKDQVSLMLVGAILLIAAIALYIIIRKKKNANRDIDFHTATHTQIE